MAVYKPTYCAPFSETVDIRTALHQDMNKVPAQYLSCKIDSSNKKITGYRIRILNEDNQQLFPCQNKVGYISPISELQMLPMFNAHGINSGINGTMLQIPFFQNNSIKQLDSLNALYYIAKFKADYIILNQELFYQAAPSRDSFNGANNIDNWVLSNDNGETYLTYHDSGNSTNTYNVDELNDDEGKEHLVKNVILDNEPLQPTDSVLIISSNADDNLKCGLWKSDENYHNDLLGQPMRLKKIGVLNVGDSCVVLKGKHFHNIIWQNMGVTDPLIYKMLPIDTQLWVDINGIPCKGLSLNNQRLKWEITLYQGNYELIGVGSKAMAVTYENLDNEWMDMKINSGNILGSTMDRIQIASQPEMINGEMVQHVPSLNNDTLVLQGTYMSAFDPYTKAGSEPDRIYVKAYDATLGHIYPSDSESNLNTLKNATRCQFFKHTNNVNAILAEDIIQHAIGCNIRIGLYVVTSKDKPWTRCHSGEDDEIWKTASVLDRRLVIESIGSIDASNGLQPYGVNPGETVLLCNQQFAKENGIYTYSAIEAIDNAEKKTKKLMYCLQRPDSYNQWSSFIGRVFYIQGGVDSEGKLWGNFNLESLAPAGAYSLWNPLEAKSGQSSLLFGKERPILLFGSNNSRMQNVLLFNTVDDYPGDTRQITKTVTVDGQDVHVGDTILFANGIYAAVTSVNYSARYYGVGNALGQLQNGDCFVVEAGRTFAKRAFKWELGTDAWKDEVSLSTAVILRNTTTRTYISPFKGLQNNMRLKLMGDNYITIDGQRTQWLPIVKVNTELNYIEHPALSEPIKSYDLLSEKYPWRYEIRSFFKTSNENPFVTYETPYLLLYKNNDLYSPLNLTQGHQIFAVRKSQMTPQDYEIFSHLLNTNHTVDFNISMYELQTAITSRSVKLAAKYIQFQQASWESYRWVLLSSKEDADGNTHPDAILQDTGFQYDKEIQTTFYGLGNGGKNGKDKQYFVALYVADSYGNTIIHVLNFRVAKGMPNYLLSEQNGNFTATLDCSTQSIILNYSNSVLPLTQHNTSSYSFYRREYEVYQKPYNPERVYNGYYSDFTGLFYEDKEHTVVLPIKKGYIYFDHQFLQYEPQGLSYTFIDGEFVLTPLTKMFCGEWEPVLLQTTQKRFRDYNIKNHHAYQYIMYLSEDENNDDKSQYIIHNTPQTFANFRDVVWVEFDKPGQGQFIKGDLLHTSTQTGRPVVNNWSYWSITELIPEENTLDAPIVKKKYKVNPEQVWVFKYDLNTGSQSQHIERNSYNTLGQFMKIGYGKQNYMQGQVSALLGREIIPLTAKSYIERLPFSREQPLSTNEQTKMIQQWQDFVYSKNPKLLKDVQGQSWIVQINSSSHTPKTNYIDTPTEVSFDWTQIGDTSNVIIYGDDLEIQHKSSDLYGRASWEPYFK